MDWTPTYRNPHTSSASSFVSPSPSISSSPSSFQSRSTSPSAYRPIPRSGSPNKRFSQGDLEAAQSLSELSRSSSRKGSVNSTASTSTISNSVHSSTNPSPREFSHNQSPFQVPLSSSTGYWGSRIQPNAPPPPSSRSAKFQGAPYTPYSTYPHFSTPPDEVTRERSATFSGIPAPRMPLSSRFSLPPGAMESMMSMRYYSTEAMNSSQVKSSPMEAEPTRSNPFESNEMQTDDTSLQSYSGHKQRRLVESPAHRNCPNCDRKLSTLWRSCELANGFHYLCNACGLRFKKGKYCPICTKVYYDADTNPLMWIKCVNCPRWTHKVCRMRKDQSNQSNDNYLCVECNKEGGEN